jgi:hypothetical protein
MLKERPNGLFDLAINNKTVKPLSCSETKESEARTCRRRSFIEVSYVVT